MSTPALEPTIGLPWYKAPWGIKYDEWPRAARRLWAYFRQPGFQGEERFTVKDRELAAALGVKRRVIQKGLRLLELLGVIRRSWDWVKDHGRVIVIILKTAGPKPREKDEAKHPARAKDKGPHPIPTQPATAEQIAAAARAAEPPEITPADEEFARKFLEDSKRRRDLARAADEAKARLKANPSPRHTPEEIRAQLDALRARTSPPPPPEADPPDGRPPDPGG